MTFQQVYDQIVWNIWGDTIPPASVPINLQSPTGLISDFHRKIQEEENFWFMETETTQAVTTGTSDYALPTYFKEPIGLRFLTSDGDYTELLRRIWRREKFVGFQSGSETADYPEYYEIFEGNICLLPEPCVDSTLYIRYYKYLDRPTNFATDDAMISNTAGALALVYRVCEYIAKILKDEAGSQVYFQKYMMELDKLKSIDWSMRSTEFAIMDYVDL